MQLDFFGCMSDISPSGQSFNVTDGLLRLLPDSGEVQLDRSLRIKLALWLTAYCFRVGHRLRLLVPSGAYPRWVRNLGTDEPLATGTKMIKIEQTLYHDSRHLSLVVLPCTSHE